MLGSLYLKSIICVTCSCEYALFYILTNNLNAMLVELRRLKPGKVTACFGVPGVLQVERVLLLMRVTMEPRKPTVVVWKISVTSPGRTTRHLQSTRTKKIQPTNPTGRSLPTPSTYEAPYPASSSAYNVGASQFHSEDESQNEGTQHEDNNDF